MKRFEDDEQLLETREWLESLEEVLQRSGPQRVQELLDELDSYAQAKGVSLPFTANTPYVNTITHFDEPAYPGDLEMERRLRALIRWNAMAMVVRANRDEEGIGGHIATYASAATLYEVGFNHFFRGPTGQHSGDLVYFQGHASPGIYARAYLAGRLTEQHLANFRHELHDHPGLASYPHPWLMPDFWKFPTVSMGLGPIAAIYHARFIKYLEDRGLKQPSDQKIWAFLGDGETDEPEALGAISVAAREKLDDLIFVINCNLQRLDGPVRGNGKIIQELEAHFKGAGWNVIKVIWGEDWDRLLEKDVDGRLQKRMQEVVDGQYQKYVVSDGAYFRQDFFERAGLGELVEKWTDQQLKQLALYRGGHDPKKVYAAYQAAVEYREGPTVILTKTIKGYGMGEAGEGLNYTHGQKKLKEQELLAFRTRFHIPLSDDDVAELPFYRMPEESPEAKYLMSRQAEMGEAEPVRKVAVDALTVPEDAFYDEFTAGTEGREISTTMAFVRMLGKLLKDPEVGRYVVPIVPDEARTFGMEALFRAVGIYAHPGQLYEPVDADNLLYYKEATDGQILEEGITEAGSMGSFLAAGTAYANHGLNMIPFYIFYSMFGMQRIGDQIWQAADSRCKGFLLGATAGRTTLAGEGLQHQDGQSHLNALAVPNLLAYDPAFAFELAVILKDGLRRMYQEGEEIFYYITLMNENYAQPAMPDGVEADILKGLYQFAGRSGQGPLTATLLGSGAILGEVMKARDLLTEFDVDAEIWSVTSYKELYKDALDTDRYNRYHPDADPRLAYVTQCLATAEGPIVAASDYVKTLPLSIAPFLPRGLVALGTDGFGRSDGREALRDFFEVDARHIALSVLSELARRGDLDATVVVKARDDWGIDPDRENPFYL